MTPETYAKFRKGIGSQVTVAVLVGVDPRTIQRREAGDVPINIEAARSITALAAKTFVQKLLEDETFQLPDIKKVFALLR